MLKVLVTDCNSRKALCVVRSLGKQGLHVFAVCKEKVNMSRFSKYCSVFEQLPNPLTEEKSYLQHLAKIIEENKIDILIPMEDETVELVIKHRDILNKVKTLLPDYSTFMTARDKGKTMERAIKLGVPCPKTFFVENIEELRETQDLIEYPVIIKARVSSGSRGLMRVHKSEDLIKRYKEVHEDYSFPIIQQYISGEYDKIQVLVVLGKDQKVKASCTYQGIREFPVDGGPVTMWKTTSFPELEDKTIDFLEGLGWVGFAEVEYIVDRNTNEYYLMEINPRFSANIALAVSIGIDFPLLFAKLALGEKIHFERNNKLNEYCQWFLPGDLLNFIFNKDRFNQEIGYFLKKPRNMHYAIISKEDIMPAVGAILSMVLNLFGSIKNLRAKLKAEKD